MSQQPDSQLPDAALLARIHELQDEGQEIFHRFDREVRLNEWHPFVPADYPTVMRALLPLQNQGLRFLEWGSGTGVITIMADMLGYEAYGIEIDPELTAIARELAKRFNSAARFATGSYLSAGYIWRAPDGDRRLGTIGIADSAYPELGHPLDDFDVVYGYPWEGEEPVMHDLMKKRAARGTTLLLNGTAGVRVFKDGVLLRGP